MQRIPFGQTECPDGYLPCSTKTSVENTICQLEADIETKCPITDIKFIKLEDVEQFESENEEDYTLLQTEINGYVLAYSKTVDALPISKTAVET